MLTPQTEASIEGAFARRNWSPAPRHGRFPNGWLSLVTENPQIESKLRRLAEESGIFRTWEDGSITIRVEASKQDDVCLTFGSTLSQDEQDQVFLLREAPASPRLRSLRSVLADCRYAWFSDFLEHGSWQSHFQPIFDLALGRPLGFEALLRARRTDGQPISPLEAMNVATATSQLPAFDERARKVALKGAATTLSTDEHLFINLDIASVPGGIDDLEPTLKLARDLGRSGSNLVFEFLESESLTDCENLLHLREELHDRGYLVALDDLTSGFSTLAILDRLHPDIAKLDRLLIQGAHANRYRGRLVQAFVDLCRDLDILLIVEGIESREDLDFMRDLGVRYVQGFLLGRPSEAPSRTIADH